MQLLLVGLVPLLLLTTTFFLDPKLQTCSHVFVRRDAHKKPLDPLYEGPYKVISRGRRHFVILVGDKKDSVTVEQLKLVQSDSPVTAAAPKRHGRP